MWDCGRRISARGDKEGAGSGDGEDRRGVHGWGVSQSWEPGILQGERDRVGDEGDTYDLSYDEEGNLVVVNKERGERLEAKRSKSKRAGAPERWVIQDGGNRPIYFERKDVETCELRKRLEEIPKERRDIRNNVEATIFQIGYHYRGDKSRYRGLVKHVRWTVSRSIWVNFRRIQVWSIRKGREMVESVIKNGNEPVLTNV